MTDSPRGIRLLYGADLDALTAEQRRDVVALLVRLRQEPEFGKELLPPQAHQRFPRSLVGWRAAKTGTVSYEHTITVVYRLSAAGDEIEVLAIAPRMASAAYRMAMDRLAPSVPLPEDEPRWKRMQRLRDAARRRQQRRE